MKYCKIRSYKQFCLQNPTAWETYEGVGLRLWTVVSDRVQERNLVITVIQFSVSNKAINSVSSWGTFSRRFHPHRVEKSQKNPSRNVFFNYLQMLEESRLMTIHFVEDIKYRYSSIICHILFLAWIVLLWLTLCIWSHVLYIRLYSYYCIHPNVKFLWNNKWYSVKQRRSVWEGCEIKQPRYRTFFMVLSQHFSWWSG